MLKQHFCLMEKQQLRTTTDLSRAQEEMALYWGYVRMRDNAIKKSLQENFTRPMLAFPTFLKELLSDPEDEVGAAVMDTTTHPATAKKKNKEQKGEEEKTKSVNNESDEEEDNMNQTSAPQEPATAPQTIARKSEKDCEINQLIDDITKSDDNEEEVLINLQIHLT
ncbi:hypothetical protein J1N35_010814 [Gossypium stocksii]|uniref:Uncharacterized protein n=1 Tax=Gossypium stocksii TaxID=47602 RepID=A0A9D3W0S9_9ROSI|nr:hypothetical protein J1N35_010814 [Gossypium stocksii]